jgi:hypothetical protein
MARRKSRKSGAIAMVEADPRKLAELGAQA